MTFFPGSILFFNVFYKARYIPRALAALGVFGSIVMLPSDRRHQAGAGCRWKSGAEAWLEAATADGRLRVKKPALLGRTFWAALSAFLMPAIYLAPLPPEEASALKQELIAMLQLHGPPR